VAKLGSGATPRSMWGWIAHYARDGAHMRRREEGGIHRLPVEVIPHERRAAFLDALNDAANAKDRPGYLIRAERRRLILMPPVGLTGPEGSDAVTPQATEGCDKDHCVLTRVDPSSSSEGPFPALLRHPDWTRRTTASRPITAKRSGRKRRLFLPRLGH